ncbi:hypothetical protein EPUL_005149 [Erysiphe pulchra]|uniref:Peptidase A2 domain-containing protein n=1 Tax=Erysiphe pulchra TaxID=225359 RepID=A0A2S4PLH4_9PEZI|nr:hypothetical protein EPUL_005149 [Erysiphe pulchra]
MTEPQQLEIIAEDCEILDSLDSQSIQDFLFKNNRFRPYPSRIPSKMNQNSSNTPINDNMSRQDLQLLLNSIPEFSPGKNLSIFINEVDNLISHLHGRINPDLEFCLNFSIRSKILNEARDFISFQNAKDWPSIRRALLQRYGDQRNEELLIAAISQCVQKRNENYLDYYCRISKSLNDLLQHLTLNIEDPNLLTYKKYEAEKLSLKTFQVGILEPYRSFISNFEFNNIEECINKCKFYDNRKQEWEYSEFLRRSQENRKPSTNIQPKQSQNRINNFTPNSPNFNFNSRNVSIRSFNNAKPPENPPTTSFNTQGFPYPINKPLPVQRKFPTNREVFGTKPGSNIMKNQPNPTPMSVSTRNTFRQRPTPMSTSTRNYSNNQVQKSRPNFTFEELYNFELDEDKADQDENFFNEYSSVEHDINYPEDYENNENFQTIASETTFTILIDSGATNSVINKKPAFEKFFKFLYKNPFEVHGLKNKINAEDNLKIPLLYELGIHDNIHLHVVDWHDKFDALLGTSDLRKLGANIDYKTNILEINNFKIPFHLEYNSTKLPPQKCKINNSLKIPVSIEKGEVILPELKFKNFTTPECLVKAQDGFCVLPVAQSMKNICVNFSERIPVIPLQEAEISNPSFDNNQFKLTNHIRTSHMNSEEKREILKLCHKFKNIFYHENSDLSFTNVVKHKIRTTDDRPVYVKSFRHPHAMKEIIQDQIQKLLEDKIIRPSISPYSAPVWIVPKKADASGKKKYRMVIDYRKLNEKNDRRQISSPTYRRNSR